MDSSYLLGRAIEGTADCRWSGASRDLSSRQLSGVRVLPDAPPTLLSIAMEFPPPKFSTVVVRTLDAQPPPKLANPVL